MKEIIIFSGPSGSGKTTLSQYLVKKVFPNNLVFSISATTRKWRGDEKDGIDYYFISEADFTRRAENGEFAEWEEVYPGTKYGTLKVEIERINSKGKIPVLDIDVKGAMKLKKVYGDKAVTVLVAPPSMEVLKERLLSRKTEAGEDLKKRLAKAKEELSHQDKFDIILVNEDLPASKRKVEKIVKENFNIGVPA